MCDYSLESLASRPARVGDKLQIHQFKTGTKGFMEVGGDKDCPVCVPLGAELAFDGSIQSYVADGWLSVEKKDLGFAVACFGEREPEVKHKHHDCLEFPDGSFAMLQNLAIEQTATVLQLPAEPKAVEKPEGSVRELEPAQA